MRNIRQLVAIAGCTLLIGAAAYAADKGTAPAANEDRLNIESLRSLNAKGSYIHIIGRSLFLTPGTVLGRLKPQDAAAMRGGWFDLGADPTAPKQIGDSLPAAWDLVLVGDYAITCNYQKFLTVYDTRDHPWREAARLDMPSMTENIITRGHLAYVANHVAGLTIVDVSKPLKPVIVSNLNPNIDCDAVALWHDTAVLYGHHESQIVLADIRDPAKPRQTGVCQLAPKIFNGGELEVENGFAYVTTKTGLVVVNVNDPANPELVATVNLGVVAQDVILKDGYAFVAADERGVRVLDVSHPNKPVEVGHYQVGKEFIALALAVERAAHVITSGTAAATADYYIYVADMTGPAKVLVFHAPVRASRGTDK